MPYFERIGARRFLATPHVGGAWDTATQHVAPALGLLVHAVETERGERLRQGLVVGRLSHDILGTVPVAEVEVSVEVVRPGRTIELVEAALLHEDRPVVRCRAWLLATRDTSGLAGSGFPPLPGPAQLAAWDPTSVWDGGFIASVEVRRELLDPGRGRYWVRTDLPLVAGEEVSRRATVAGLLDIANGMTVRVDPRRVAFPNVDLTTHLFREPRGEWVGFDTTVSFGPDGLGVTSSVVHDLDGPVGTVSQLLTVRPG